MEIIKKLVFPGGKNRKFVKLDDATLIEQYIEDDQKRKVDWEDFETNQTDTKLTPNKPN